MDLCGSAFDVFNYDDWCGFHGVLLTHAKFSLVMIQATLPEVTEDDVIPRFKLSIYIYIVPSINGFYFIYKSYFSCLIN